MTLSAKTLRQINSLSAEDVVMVSNLVDYLATDKRRNRRAGFLGTLGIISLKISDLFTKKDIMTDDEVEDVIRSVRKKPYANRH